MSTDGPVPDQPQPLDVAWIASRLAGLRLGQPLIYLPEIASTNTHAMDLARQGAAEGTLVLTDEQTAGRGRIGRVWRSLPGQQLELSLVLRPQAPAHFLVMASALAVAEAITAVTTLATDIKWPNDVVVGGRKVCGILIETSQEIAVVGIGINVNGSFASDPELAARATTLAEAAGHTVVREEVVVEVLRRLDASDRALNSSVAARSDLRDAWRARLITLGQRVTVQQGETIRTGIAEDVDGDGVLLLRDDDGARHSITWGDVAS